MILRSLGLFCVLAISFLCEAQEDYISAIDEEEREVIATYLQDRYWNETSTQSLLHKKLSEEQLSASAVILQKDILKEYFRNSRNFLRNVNAEHTVIKIQDEKGITENLIFLFEEIKNEQVINLSALRIIKTNGNQQIIDIDQQAVTIQSGKVIKKRLVIPNLEVGDIIDYYTYLEFRVLFPQQYSRTYDPVYIIPQSTYPILEYNLNFSLGPSAFMNVSAYQLPDFEKTAYKVNKRTFTRFTLHQQNLLPYPKELAYFYPFQTVPNLKFQIFIGPYYGNTDIKDNLGGTAKMNTSVLPAKLQDYMVEMTSTGNKLFYKQFKKQYKSDKLKGKRTDEREVIDLMYDFYRQKKVIRSLQHNGQLEENSQQFTRTIHYALNKLNIDHDVLVVFDRRMSNIDQFILTEEMELLIKTKKDDIVLSDPDRFSMPNEIPYQFEGSGAYVFTPETRHLDKGQLKASTASDNILSKSFKLQLSPSLTDLEVELMTDASGHHKKDMQSKFKFAKWIALKNETSKRSIDWAGNYKKKEYLSIQQDINNQLAVEREQAIKNRLNQLSEYLGQVQMDSYEFNIIEPGNESDNANFILKEAYRLEEFNTQVQKTILIPIGNMVLKAVDIPKDRKYDINFDYPQHFEYNIELLLPEGFTIGSIDHLVKKVFNSVGYFESSCTIEEQSMLWHISGTFDQYFLTSEKWNEVAQLLEAADQLRLQSIVLQSGE